MGFSAELGSATLGPCEDKETGLNHLEQVAGTVFYWGYIGFYRGYIGVLLRIYWGYIGVMFCKYCPPIMENQMEKKMENKMETGGKIGL